MAEASTSASADAGKRTSVNAGDDATRGRPYYEKLRNDLRLSITRKRELDTSMAAVESTIAKLESNYLEETSAAGNIIKGFDNYIKASGSASTSSGPGTATRRKGGVNDQDRIFSRSSVSWTARDSSPPPAGASGSGQGSLRGGGGGGGGEGSSMEANNSARETPNSVGVVTGGRHSTKNKKKATVDQEADGDVDERPSKRGKVSWGRD
ncbi:MAG: hypothetical protein M1831_007446 [Alyxoria varia]|nr:MAG: hypothetical protein M1831_007446 [Alyxoria varia]